MPGKGRHTAKFDRCVEQVMAKGNEKTSAYAICTAQFQKSGEEILAAEEVRELQLVGATGAHRRETWKGKEWLVVPTIMLMEGVIHAVNAENPEFVPKSLVESDPELWDGHPILLGHAVRGGKQCSAHDDAILAAQQFGVLRRTYARNAALGTESWIDPVKLKEFGRADVVKRIEENDPIPVSIGAFVSTDHGKSGDHKGKKYRGEWLAYRPDHLAFLPDGRGACSLEMGCGTHRAAAMRVCGDHLEALGDVPGHEFHGNQWTTASGTEWKRGQLAQHADDPEHKVRIVGKVEGAGKLGQLHGVQGSFAGVKNRKGEHLGYYPESNLRIAQDGDFEPRAAAGARHSASDMKAIQAVHDHATTLGAKCPDAFDKFMSHGMRGLSGESLDERMRIVNDAVQKEYGSALNAWPQTVYDDHVVYRSKDKLWSVDYEVSDGEVEFTSDPIEVKQEYVAAASYKDCETCDGTGQVKKDGAQMDCPACHGEGKMRAAQAPCGCHKPETLRPAIRHEGGKWVLYSKDGTRRLGAHDTESEAKEHGDLIEAATKRRSLELAAQ